jgi:hypothetical protein
MIIPSRDSVLRVLNSGFLYQFALRLRLSGPSVVMILEKNQNYEDLLI